MLRTHRVRTFDQVRSFLDGAEPVEVQPLGRSACYEFVARTLRRFGYWTVLGFPESDLLESSRDGRLR